MATHTRYFRWDDPSAPTLSGTAGSLLELLRACLVGTDGVAYGSGENEKLAAGWTEEFTGTNVAVFRNSLAAGGTGDYFRIDDNGIAVGGAREAMLTAYNTMSDIDTGTGLMPPAVDFPSGGPLRKSNTLDTTARKWIVVADEITAWIWIEAGAMAVYGFGDIESDIPSDAFRAFIAPGWRENNNGNCALTTLGRDGFLTPTNNSSLYLSRSYSLTGGPAKWSIPTLAKSASSTIQPNSNSSQMGGAISPLGDPGAGTGLRYFHPAICAEGGIVRGRLRGMYVPLNDLSSITDGTEEVGAIGLPADSTLVLLRTYSGASIGGTGCVAIETTRAW